MSRRHVVMWLCCAFVLLVTTAGCEDDVQYGSSAASEANNTQDSADSADNANNNDLPDGCAQDAGSSCFPMGCPSDREVTCGDVSPECPVELDLIAREGCYACVDPSTCESPVWSCDQAWRDEGGTCRGLNGAPHPEVCCGVEDSRVSAAIAWCSSSSGFTTLLITSGVFVGGPPPPCELAAIEETGDVRILFRADIVAPNQVYTIGDDGVRVRACIPGEICQDASEGTITIGDFIAGEFVSGGFTILDRTGQPREGRFDVGICDWSACE